MKKQMWWWAVALVLMLGLVGQYAVYRSSRPSGVHATWRPVDSYTDVTNMASNVVEAEVISTAPGPETVVQLDGSIEPSGRDVIPHRDVRLRIRSSEKGTLSAGQEITVRQVGGEITLPQGPAPGTKGQNNPEVLPAEDKSKADPSRLPTPRPRPLPSDPNNPPTAQAQVFVLDDDPPYQPGERYFLSLEQRPGNGPGTAPEEGVYQVVHPAGRYQVNGDGSLSAVGNDLVSMSVEGRRLTEVQSAARGLTTIPVSTSGDAQRRVSTGSQPGMPTTGTDQSLLLWIVAAVAVMGLGAGLVSRRRRA